MRLAETLRPKRGNSYPVRFKWGFGQGRLKDKFAFFEAYKSPTPKRRKLLAKRRFSTPDFCSVL